MPREIDKPVGVMELMAGDQVESKSGDLMTYVLQGAHPLHLGNQLVVLRNHRGGAWVFLSMSLNQEVGILRNNPTTEQKRWALGMIK